MCFSKIASRVRSWWAAPWFSLRTIADKEALPQDNCFRVIAFLLTIILAFVLFSVDHYQWPIPLEDFRPFVEKIVEALFVAAILALTVDWFLKKQIARDAFRASIGYILPGYLQDEMRAIYSNEIVCIDHSEDVKIEVLSNDLVRMTVRVQRTIKNISNNHHRFVPKIWVDEWFVPDYPSTIDDCGYRVQGGEAHSFGAACAKAELVPKLYAEGREVTLPPQIEVEVWLSFSEIKRRSDLSYLVFSYATDKPRVRITVPDRFGSAVEFTHRLDTKKLTTGETILPGLLLPNQCIIVRWWDEDRRTE
jgi:hypothetical protein